MSINELIAKWREKLRQAGVLDNDMISVPGDGVIKMLDEFERVTPEASGTTDTPHLCRHEEVCATVCHDCGHARCTACEPKCLWCDPLNEEAT